MKTYSFKDCQGALETIGSNDIVRAVLERLEVETTGKGDVRLKWTNTVSEGGQLVFTPDFAVKVATMLLNLQEVARKENGTTTKENGTTTHGLLAGGKATK